MENKNKAFITSYGNALSGVTKTKALIEEYVTDKELINHILFFDTVFPQYEILIDQLIAEDKWVIIRGRLKGCHKGELNGIQPTHRHVEFPLAVGYEIVNGKIIHHWLLADQMTLMEQLGVMNVPA